MASPAARVEENYLDGSRSFPGAGIADDGAASGAACGTADQLRGDSHALAGSVARAQGVAGTTQNYPAIARAATQCHVARPGHRQLWRLLHTRRVRAGRQI